MESSPDLSVEDIAPVLGQQLLEIIALRKEVLRLQRALANLEAIAPAPPDVPDRINGAPV